MKKAIYNEKYLTAVRYPRGSEEVSFSKNLINSEYTFLKNGISNILVISYGRIFNEAYKAQSLLSADGINCDLLKLTKIYPVPEKLMDEIKKYNNIIFFEEAISNGSISEKFGCMLIESGYKGDYIHIAVKGFIKQATVNSSLDNSGLTFNKMADYIRIRSIENGKA